MGLFEKLTAMKETIIESAEEYAILKDMKATEIAERYGYEKLLTYVRRNIMEAKAEQIEIVEGDEESELDTKPVLIKINKCKDEDNKITIAAEGFGEKEVYDLNIIKIMLKKYGIEASIGQITDEDYLRLSMIPSKPSLNERIGEIYENREEYLDIALEKAVDAKKAVGNATKKVLNNLADWANDNL